MFYFCLCIYLFASHLAFASGATAAILLCMALATVYALFGDEDNATLLFFFLIPSNRILTVGPASVLILILLAILIRSCISNRGGIPLSVGMIVSTLVLLLHSCMQSVVDLSFSPLIAAAKIPVVLIAMTHIFINAFEKRVRPWSYVKMLALGIAVSTIISIAIDPEAFAEGERFTVGNESGQNVLGITCSVIAVLYAVEILRTKIDIEKLGITALLILVGILTGSRSFLLSFAIGLSMLLIGIVRHVNSESFMRMTVFCLSGLIVLSILIVFVPAVGDYFSTAIERVVSPRNGDISNERFDIWKDYFIAFSNNPKLLLFGTSKLTNYNLDIVAHNFLIEQVASYGLIGCIPISIMYAISMNVIRRNCVAIKQSLCVAAAPLVTLLAASCFSHSLLGIPQTTLLSLAITQFGVKSIDRGDSS